MNSKTRQKYQNLEMASALEKAFKGVLKKSESQKAFSPWWADAEDKLLYAVMILGETTQDVQSNNRLCI